MKQFISKVKNLSQKAAEIKAAMQQLPPKVAEIRETVAATTGQLQQLKSELQFTVAGLKAESEDHLSQALLEINSNTEVFAKAGFALRGVDLEISPVQRLIVRLHRKEDVHASMLRSLVSANQHQRTIQALLSAMLQAKQMAETVELGKLQYRELLVAVGPVPSVRLCWSPEEISASTPSTPPPLPTAPVPESKGASTFSFGEGSFFAKTPPPAAPATVAGPTIPEATGAKATELRPLTTEVVNPPAAPESESLRRDPLARFKKMPDLSKYRK